VKPRRKPRTKLRLALACVLLALAALAIVLRFTLRDAWQPLAFLFYATPTGVLAALVTAAALLLPTRRRVRLALVVAAIAWWAGDSFRFADHLPAATGDVTLLCWNVAHGYLSYDAVADIIEHHDADLAAVVEAGREGDDRFWYWRKRFPSHHLSQVKRGTLLISRHRITHHREVDFHRTLRAVAWKVALPAGPVWVVLVDVDAQPMRPRREPLAHLATLHETLDAPILIMGDLNTPSTSAHFRPLRQRFVNAFDAAGRGFRPTWPMPAPVLDLDQIWVDRRLTVAAAATHSTARSDHRPLTARIRQPRNPKAEH